MVPKYLRNEPNKIAYIYIMYMCTGGGASKIDNVPRDIRSAKSGKSREFLEKDWSQQVEHKLCKSRNWTDPDVPKSTRLCWHAIPAKDIKRQNVKFRNNAIDWCKVWSVESATVYH